jgi:hypothetical protein
MILLTRLEGHAFLRPAERVVVFAEPLLPIAAEPFPVLQEDTP